MIKQKNIRLAGNGVKKESLGKNLAITFVAVFMAAGLVWVFRSFAYSSIPVFTTDPDYWRDRIGYCESVVGMIGSGQVATPANTNMILVPGEARSGRN